MIEHDFNDWSDDDVKDVTDFMKKYPASGSWRFGKLNSFGTIMYTAIGETMMIPHNSISVEGIKDFVDGYYITFGRGERGNYLKR